MIKKFSTLKNFDNTETEHETDFMKYTETKDKKFSESGKQVVLVYVFYPRQK